MLLLADTETTAYVGALGVLATVIGAMWKWFVDRQKQTDAKLEQCHEGHKKSDAKILEISCSLAELHGRNSGIKELADEVLRTIADVSHKAASKPQEDKGGEHATHS